MTKPRLSLCLPNYNHARFLPIALDAILSQSRLPDEMLIMDDGSSDESVEILRAYTARHAFIRLIISEKNRGAAATLGEMLALAQGTHFYAPAADDMIRPGFIEESMNILELFPEAGLCSTLSAVMDENGLDEGVLSESPFVCADAQYISAPAARDELWRRGSWIHGNTVIFRRDALKAAGGYRAELASYADGFVHEVIALERGACFVPRPLACWRRMPGTLSANANADLRKVRQVRDTAFNYMKTEYRKIFPAAYVVRWRRRWNSGSLLSFSRAKASEWRAGILELTSGSGWVIRALGRLSEFVISIGLVVVTLAAAALRWFDLGWVLRRRTWRDGRRSSSTATDGALARSRES